MSSEDEERLHEGIKQWLICSPKGEGALTADMQAPRGPSRQAAVSKAHVRHSASAGSRGTERAAGQGRGKNKETSSSGSEWVTSRASAQGAG